MCKVNVAIIRQPPKSCLRDLRTLSGGICVPFFDVESCKCFGGIGSCLLRLLVAQHGAGRKTTETDDQHAHAKRGGLQRSPACPEPRPLSQAHWPGQDWFASEEALQVVSQAGCRGVAAAWVLVQALQTDVL